MRKLIYSLVIALLLCNYCFAQSIIDPELQIVLDDTNKDSSESISINIIFKSQLNVDELNQRANNYNNKNHKRQYVISELKNFSEKTQQEVLSIIKAEENRGEVSNIICHWLSNSITCNATKDVIEELSKREDILMIGYNCDRDALLTNEEVTIETHSSRASEADITNNVVQVSAPEVWDLGYTGEGVLVALLDTGVNYEHIDLADHLWDGGSQYPNHGYNSYDNNTITIDNRGHGTHCAGIICGDGTSGTHTGVAPNVTLMCVKALNDNGNANANSICSGMEFAVEHGADVLSMSLGIANASVADRTMIRQTCVNTLQAGVIAAVAAGNEGDKLNSNPVPDNVRVPGSCPAPWIHPDQQDNAGAKSCVVSVGAVNKNDKVAGTSSRGPVTWKNTSFGDYPYNPGIGLIRPDVCAPGVDIISLSHTGEGYAKMSGTSQATPCVAGVISLMLSKNPNLTPAEISEILETTAVKLSDKKNNDTGSGRVDAFAAINGIDMGSIIFKSFTFTDENNNGNVNSGEKINLNINFENVSSKAYNNIKAVLKCDNELVNITKSEYEITSINANEDLNLNNMFTFILDDNIESKTKLFFDVEFYENSQIISKTRFNVTAFDNTIRYASLKIDGDNNNNGILEAGESASMIITINNEGNEIALGLTAKLSSNSDLISITNEEVKFTNDFAPNCSETISFNVSLSQNADSDFNFPLTLEITDKYNKVNTLNIDYKSSCDIVYNLIDEFGDGWNGAKIIANYHDNGIVTENYTVNSGKSETYTKNLKSGTYVTLEWKNGSVDDECSYSVNNYNGVEIYSGKGRQKGEFYNWNFDCSCQNKIMETCESVNNLKISIGNHSVTLSWEAPDADNVIAYEIYRETILLGTTANLSYTDNNLASGTYRYNVRPIYGSEEKIECYGAVTTQEIAFCEGIGETFLPNVTIYPNPANDKLFIETESEIEEILVYDIYGRCKIVKSQSRKDTKVLIDLSDLSKGVYFVNVKTSVGNVVKKIAKY